MLPRPASLSLCHPAHLVPFKDRLVFISVALQIYDSSLRGIVIRLLRLPPKLAAHGPTHFPSLIRLYRLLGKSEAYFGSSLADRKEKVG